MSGDTIYTRLIKISVVMSLLFLFFFYICYASLSKMSCCLGWVSLKADLFCWIILLCSMHAAVQNAYTYTYTRAQLVLACIADAIDVKTKRCTFYAASYVHDAIYRDIASNTTDIIHIYYFLPE